MILRPTPPSEEPVNTYKNSDSFLSKPPRIPTECVIKPTTHKRDLGSLNKKNINAIVTIYAAALTIGIIWHYIDM